MSILIVKRKCMFGGYGSVRNILKSNKNLLRKKSIFEKNLDYSDRKRLLLSGAVGDIEFKDISKGKLIDIKEKIRNEAKLEAILNFRITLFIVFLIFTASLFFVNEIYKHDNLIKLKNESRLKNERLQIFNMYMEEGDAQLRNNHTKNAIYFYKKAEVIFPNDSLLKIKLKQISFK